MCSEHQAEEGGREGTYRGRPGYGDRDVALAERSPWLEGGRRGGRREEGVAVLQGREGRRKGGKEGRRLRKRKTHRKDHKTWPPSLPPSLPSSFQSSLPLAPPPFFRPPLPPLPLLPGCCSEWDRHTTIDFLREGGKEGGREGGRERCVRCGGHGGGGRREGGRGVPSGRSPAASMCSA